MVFHLSAFTTYCTKVIYCGNTCKAYDRAVFRNGSLFRLLLSFQFFPKLFDESADL